MSSDDQEKTTTGGCLCGEVRYEIKGEALMSGVCHCRDCQRATGAGHSPGAAYLEQQVSITGTVCEHSMQGDSGNSVTRCFCPTCGSRLFVKPQSNPGMIMVSAGTLDKPDEFTPQMLVYTRSCPSWHSLDKNLAAFEEMPPQRA